MLLTNWLALPGSIQIYRICIAFPTNNLSLSPNYEYQSQSILFLMSDIWEIHERECNKRSHIGNFFIKRLRASMVSLWNFQMGNQRDGKRFGRNNASIWNSRKRHCSWANSNRSFGSQRRWRHIYLGEQHRQICVAIGN